MLVHGLHWQLNLFPQLYIGKWTVGLHLSTSRMVFFVHHLLDRPCVLQMPSFGRRAKAHLANTPTERLSLRQPLVLLHYTMNGFLASNGNGKQSQRVSSAFAALVHRSRCLFSAGGCDCCIFCRFISAVFRLLAVVR